VVNFLNGLACEHRQRMMNELISFAYAPRVGVTTRIRTISFDNDSQSIPSILAINTVLKHVTRLLRVGVWDRFYFFLRRQPPNQALVPDRRAWLRRVLTNLTRRGRNAAVQGRTPQVQGPFGAGSPMQTGKQIPRPMRRRSKSPISALTASNSLRFRSRSWPSDKSSARRG
jgi:hypothetical protein